MPNSIQSLRRKAFERQSGRCVYCGVAMWLSSPDELPIKGLKLSATKKLQCTAEHLVPRSEGGRNVAKNIAAACAHCNHTRHRRKSPLEPVAYRAVVRRRVKRRAWHDSWVFKQGLLQQSGPLMSCSTPPSRT